MARIAGYLSFKPAKLEPNLLERMANSFNLPHPGFTFLTSPQEDQTFSFGVTLVETGVSAQALAQKIVRQDDKLYILDGRVDGYADQEPLDLAPEETPRYLAEKWHNDPLNFYARLRGGVAGLCIDPKRMSLSLFRDRFGARTFYYFFKDGLLLFSSEIKALLQYDNHRFSLNQNMLGRYLSMNYRMWFGRRETFLADIKEMPIASYLTIREQGLTADRYWAPPDEVWSPLVDDTTYISIYNNLLNHSVNHALARSQRRLFFVSGGLDAPVIAAKAYELTGERVDCCASIFPEHPAHDESTYVHTLTNKIGGSVHLYQMTQEEFLETYNLILSRHDQPLISPTYVLFYRMMEIARDYGYDTVFGGGGGDVVSQGCLEYQPYLLADYYHLGQPTFERELNAWCQRTGPYLRYWPGKPEPLKALIREMVDLHQPGLIRNNPDWVRVDRNTFGPELTDLDLKAPYIGFQYNTYRQSRLAEEIFQQAIAGHFVEEINSSTFQLAGFDPFWNLELVEFGFKLPLKMLLRDGWTKYIVRQATADLLPDQLRLRPDKTGLGLPLDAWLRSGPLAEAVGTALQSPIFRESQLFNVTFVEQAFQSHLAGAEANGNLLWKIFAFCRWAERWLAT